MGLEEKILFRLKLSFIDLLFGVSKRWIQSPMRKKTCQATIIYTLITGEATLVLHFAEGQR